MSVLDRSALDESPLADLHTIASELSIDGYRRLRRADLIDAILGEQPAAATETDSEDSEDDQLNTPPAWAPWRTRADRRVRRRAPRGRDRAGDRAEAEASHAPRRRR